jgi:hypothetical protein
MGRAPSFYTRTHTEEANSRTDTEHTLTPFPSSIL